MIDEIQARFLPRFVAGARVRLERALAAIGDGTWRAKSIAAELHTIAGEASVMGLADMADLARRSEQAVRAALAPDASKVRAVLEELGRRIDELKPPPR